MSDVHISTGELNVYHGTPSINVSDKAVVNVFKSAKPTIEMHGGKIFMQGESHTTLHMITGEARLDGNMGSAKVKMEGGRLWICGMAEVEITGGELWCLGGPVWLNVKGGTVYIGPGCDLMDLQRARGKGKVSYTHSHFERQR